MTIISLKKTFENEQLVYCNIDNKIIECICLTKLVKYIVKNYDNKDLEIYICDKVKVITIYDIYKNIIYEPIKTNLFKYSIKIGTLLKKLIEKDIYFFKTFMIAFIRNTNLNDINNIKYDFNYNGTIHKFLYDNIKLIILNDMKTFNIYNNERNIIHKFRYESKYEKKIFNYYRNYNDIVLYNIHNSYIEITKGKYPFYQTIYCHTKKLKIFKIYKYYKNIEIINERINDNNEITYLLKFDNNGKIKEEFISNNTNPPFSKPLRKSCIELIDYYNKNITNYTKLIRYCLKKEKVVHNNLLLMCELEIFNSK